MFQLLLQYLLGDDDDVQRERKENSKSQFLFAKTRSGSKKFHDRKWRERRKKERKKETLLTESCSEGAVRMSMLVAEDMMRDDVWYK